MPPKKEKKEQVTGDQGELPDAWFYALRLFDSQ